MPRKWSKINELDLVRFVDSNARDLLPHLMNVYDLQGQTQGQRFAVEAIYSCLLKREIQYAAEPRTSSKWQPTQAIRLASEILNERPEGTCLDLALLFCGLCLGYELVPILIVLERHALVAVSQNYTLRNYDRREPREDELFKNALVGKDRGDELREILTNGAYLVIECTGFASSHTLPPQDPEGAGRNANGVMGFEQATSAGSQQLLPAFRQPFKFALDIAVALYFHEMESWVPLDQSSRFYRHHSSAASRPDDTRGPLPYLLNRSDQERALRAAVVRHRALTARRPFICLIHGDQYECHPEFVERLETATIPRMLDRWNPGEKDKGPLMKYRITLPAFENMHAADWRQSLWEALAEAMKIEAPDPQAEVTSFVASHHLAIIIEASILSERLRDDPAKRIAAILNFWNAWSDLPTGLLFIVCVSFKYQKDFDVRGKFSWLPWSKGINHRIRSHLQSERVRATNESIVCLPELRSIEQSDAEDAINNELIRRRYHLTERDVREIYRDESGPIRMDDLLSALLKLNSDRLGTKHYA